MTVITPRLKWHINTGLKTDSCMCLHYYSVLHSEGKNIINLWSLLTGLKSLGKAYLCVNIKWPYPGMQPALGTPDRKSPALLIQGDPWTVTRFPVQPPAGAVPSLKHHSVIHGVLALCTVSRYQLRATDTTIHSKDFASPLHWEGSTMHSWDATLMWTLQLPKNLKIITPPRAPKPTNKNLNKKNPNPKTPTNHPPDKTMLFPNYIF